MRKTLMSDIFLPSSIAFKGYKCFVEETKIPWFSRFNVIIGRNNSGKSSFIDVIHSLCDPDFRASVSKDIDITLTYTINDYKYFDISNLLTYNYGSDQYAIMSFRNHFAGKKFDVRVNLRRTDQKGKYVNSFDMESSVLSDGQYSIRKRDNVNLNPFPKSVFRYISSERDIGPESFFSETEDRNEIEPNGNGTTKYVCSILNNKQKNDAIIQEDLLNAFNEVLGPDGEYKNIKVKQDNGDNWEIVLEDAKRNQYPISKLGSGLKTILLVLINLIAVPYDHKEQNMVFAFEELENNLHPALEKRLYSYIFNYAKNHDYIVFLTTHSPIAIDMFSREESVHLYKTELKYGSAQIVPIASFDESIEVIDELGIKASDLLQANGIIWVEGPSDRIYIKKWLNMLYPEKFVEGRDYQFVYYGGRLLAHYTACDPYDEEVENYINVLAVNTKSFFVMDSDKSSCCDQLAHRKEHIKDKLEMKKISYWITEGREIENYLDLSKDNINLSQFDKLDEKLPDYDKIRFAKQHCSNVDFEKFNLKESLSGLANQIAKWNNISLS